MLAFSQIVSSLGNKYLTRAGSQLTVLHQKYIQKQNENFKKLKKALVGTRIYKDLNLTFINSYQEYAQHVPIFNYDDYSPYVDMIIAGHKNILFKDAIYYFGLSSGTSGQDSKRIPYNEKMISLFLRSQRKVASRISYLEPKLNLIESARLTFGSDPFLYSENGFKFGYISGILSTRVPKALIKKTFPSIEVLAITNWNKKIELLIQESIHQDIRIVSGIPTYIISIFDAILAHTGKKTIREIWPNLNYFIYAATPIKQYVDRIDRLVGHPINYYGLYAATEAVIGIPYEKYTNGRQRYLLNDDLLYSFSPVENPKKQIALNDIELGVPYMINIGSPNGFIHYSMKDVIIFSLEKADLVFEFVGRKSTGMNLAAEKVSDDEILDCVISTKQKLNIDIRHFFLSPSMNDGKISYFWTLFMPSNSKFDLTELTSTLDSELMRINLDYKDCREVQILGPAKLKIMSADYLKSYFEENREKGQFKMKTTFETAEEYLVFMNKYMDQKIDFIE